MSVGNGRCCLVQALLCSPDGTSYILTIVRLKFSTWHPSVLGVYYPRGGLMLFIGAVFRTAWFIPGLQAGGLMLSLFCKLHVVLMSECEICQPIQPTDFAV